MMDSKRKIFFSGIAGSGMSAIAAFMADKGHIISGSDRAFDVRPEHPLKKTFEAAGIALFPQDGSGLDATCELAVFSTAVEPDRPEAVRARELGIPVKTRPEFLAHLTESFSTIAVSGTSGKSTTAGMLTFLMRELGLNPNFIGGGRVRQFRTDTRPGNSLAGSSDHLIIEACESDGTIVHYRPELTLILNLALDHHAVEKTAGMFEDLIKHTSGMVIINADDGNLASLRTKKAVTFSLERPADYRPVQVRCDTLSTNFSLHGTDFTLSLPGRHNLSNAIACIAVLAEQGIPLNDMAGILPRFQGIERRLDIHLNDGTGLVIDDYAHNPHKISCLMETVRGLSREICYVFQPHGFGPTRLMKEEYIDTFSVHLRGSDHLILLPIYYAGGTAAQDISSSDLADAIRKRGKSVEAVKGRDEILEHAGRFSTYIIFGARDETLSEFASELARIVGKRVSGKERKLESS